MSAGSGSAARERLRLAQEQRRERAEDLLDQRIDWVLDRIGLSEPEVLALSEADTVGPAARHKLRGLLRYYAKKAHPFTACVRDNRKRFGARAEAICAVLKDIIRGTTKWRGHPSLDHGAPGAMAASRDESKPLALFQVLDADIHALLEQADLDKLAELVKEEA